MSPATQGHLTDSSCISLPSFTMYLHSDLLSYCLFVPSVALSVRTIVVYLSSDSLSTCIVIWFPPAPVCRHSYIHTSQQVCHRVGKYFDRRHQRRFHPQVDLLSCLRLLASCRAGHMLTARLPTSVFVCVSEGSRRVTVIATYRGHILSPVCESAHCHHSPVPSRLPSPPSLRGVRHSHSLVVRNSSVPCSLAASLTSNIQSNKSES